MKRRFISFLLALVMVLGMLPVTAWAATTVDSGTCGENLTWKLTSDGLLRISGTGAMYEITYDIYPDTPDYLLDTPWEDYRDQITAVVMEEGITHIADEAFCDLSAMEEITIPASIKTIATSFDGCSSLRAVYISDIAAWCAIEFPNPYAASNPLWLESDLYLNGQLVTNLIIPEGVEKIPDRAFVLQDCLTDVSIPSTVKTIGELSFGACKSLRSIEIPGSVVSIVHAFDNCKALTSVVLNEGLVDLGAGTFAGCSGLSEITIPSTVKTIGNNAFRNCTGLKSVYFCGDAPEFVLSEYETNYNHFQNITTTIYYPAGNATWTADVMQDYGGNLTWVPYGEPEESNILKVNDGTFSYWSAVEDKEVNYTFDYDESWFFDNSGDYNHDLAKMSMRVALAAARTGNASIKDLLDNKLGFQDVEYYLPTPTENTIGYSMGHKKIVDTNGEHITLVAVAVRGGGYKAEWASNFTVGSTSIHKGFSDAAELVVNGGTVDGYQYKGVKKYIEELEIDGKVKVWFSGYSRAAAVSNIAAYHLAETAAKGKISGLSEADVWAYCFECPRGVTTSHPNLGYGNIYNIVNPIDLVPMVAPEDWDFGRYGITYCLPSNEINYKNIKKAYSLMKEEYDNILQTAGSSEELNKLTTFSKSQGSFCDKAVGALADFFVDQGHYFYLFEEAIANSLKTFNGGGLELKSIIETFLNVIPTFAIYHPVISGELLLYVGDIARAHYPELCMAWMDSLSGVEGYTTYSRVRYLLVNCPVDVSVYDSNGVLVAQIINDEVQEIEESTIGAMLDENNQKIICLPVDEEFDIVVNATGSGEMSYQVEDYDVVSGETVRLISYYDIPIEEGKQFNGTVGTDDTVNTVCSLSDEKGATIEPSNVKDAGEICEYSVKVTANEVGEVTGGGRFIEGEYALVTASAAEGASFAGWYEGETLVSADAEYRFRVSKDTELTAKFDAGVTRIFGADRYETAFKTAEVLKQQLGVEKFDNIVVACGDNFADALGGSYLAAKKNAPILLVKSSKIDAVKSYIKANLNPGGTVYLLGGTAAIPSAMDKGLDGFNVKRLAGATRYDTNLLILQEAGVTNEDILICTGKNFADSLSAAAAGRPILLVKDSLNDSQKAFLQSHAANKKYILGGTAAVSTSVENQVKAYGTVERIGGNTRYETSVLIAKEFFPHARQAALAYAQNFPDGLSGGALAYAMKAPLVLTASGKEAAAAAYAKEQGITSGVIFGGNGLISDKAARTIFQMKSGDAIQIG